MRHIQTLRDDLTRLTATQPLEPVYSIPDAAVLLYCAPATVLSMCSRERAHLSPPMYRWDVQHRSHRMLTVADLRFLRSKLLSPTISRRLSRQRREALAQAAA